MRIIITEAFEALRRNSETAEAQREGERKEVNSEVMRRLSIASIVAVLGLVAVSCGGEEEVAPASTEVPAPTATSVVVPTDTPAAVMDPTEEPTKETVQATSEPDPTSPPEPTEPPAATEVAMAPERDLDIVTLLPFDAIPAIDNPEFFDDLETANTFYTDGELVLGVEIDGDARAYSVPLLSSREIVNDVVGGKPIAVTW